MLANRALQQSTHNTGAALPCPDHTVAAKPQHGLQWQGGLRCWACSGAVAAARDSSSSSSSLQPAMLDAADAAGSTPCHAKHRRDLPAGMLPTVSAAVDLMCLQQQQPQQLAWLHNMCP